jgi:uncharacterized coiled-coil protein SlyX
MPEDFKEDELDGKILVHSYENEGIKLPKPPQIKLPPPPKLPPPSAVANFFKPATNAFSSFFKIFRGPPPPPPPPPFNWGLFNVLNQQQSDADRRLADANRKADAETKRANDLAASFRVSGDKIRRLEHQLRQLLRKIARLEETIREKDRLIDRKKKHIAYLIQENRRLRKKTNTLLDNLQYYRTMALGNEKVDGYENVIVKQEIRYKELSEQEIGKPIRKPKKEGFAGFPNLNAIKKKLDETNRNINYAINRGNAQTMRAQDLTNKMKVAADRIQNLEIQIKQSTARIAQLENIIIEKDIIIDDLNKQIQKLNKENMRLRKKVNALIDNLQYFRKLVLGNDEVDGYKDTVVKNQMKYEDLLQKEIGTPVTSKKEGLVNYKPSYESVQEGFVEGTASYNAVFTENQVLKNKIDNTTNVHSVDNQLFANTKRKINNWKFANYILIFVFCGAFLYGCYNLYKQPEMNDVVKILFAIGMLLSIIILHTIEYAIFNIFPYISALLIGTPYDPSEYWNKPGIYDNLPTP